MQSQEQVVRHVEMVIYPEFKSFEAIGPMTVFTYANKYLQSQGMAAGYDVKLVSTQAGPVTSDTGVSFHANHELGAQPLPHSVMIVGAHDIERIVCEQQAIVEWLKLNNAKVSRIAALCSGAFFLAQAGLLSGRRATTHWRMAQVFQERFPETQVDIDSIFIRQGNLWTSAGVSASVDLALAFVEEDFGHDLALKVARDLVIFLKRPGGQSQFSANLTAQMTQAPIIRNVQEWALANIQQKIGVGLMASRAAMSTRTFTRTFHREVGVCPSEFLERARIDLARRLLSEGDLPVKSIAFKCGFSTADQMRVSFRKYLAVTPMEYRQRFLLRSSAV